MPGPYDGYATEMDRGYKVEVAGVTIAESVELETAIVLLEEHAGDRPKWLVTKTGSAAALA